MSKGLVFYNEFKEFTDNLTGRKIVQLTGDDCLSHHPYFYNKMVTEDGRYLIYASDRSGNRNLYKLDLNSGQTTQLTDTDLSQNQFSDFSPILSKDDQCMYYMACNGIIKIDLNTLEEEMVYESDSDFLIGFFGISMDGNYIIIQDINKEDVVLDKDNWDKLEAQWEQEPHCRLIYLDIKANKWHIVLDEHGCWIGHPLIRPGNNNHIMFCHEGPQWRIDARLWLINSDGSNMRCAKPRVDEDKIITHEFWLTDGSALAYVHKDHNDIATIRTIDPVTLEENIMMTCTYNCHLNTNRDHTYLVGDGQPEEAVLPETGNDRVETMTHNKPYLFLIDVKNRSEEILCRHGSTFKPYGNLQDSHPHPYFTPDSKAIIFTSDMGGLPAVYKVIL